MFKFSFVILIMREVTANRLDMTIIRCDKVRVKCIHDRIGEMKMITIEQVEKLRAYANVSFEEAKLALEACNGDLLEAVIYLEKTGKVNRPLNGGSYRADSSGYQEQNQGAEEQASYEEANKEYYNFSAQMKKIWDGFCKLVHKANTNYFVMKRKNGTQTMVPVTILVLGLCFFFWIICPLLVVGLFFGWSYQFAGPDLGKDSINSVMDSVSETAEDLKRSMKDEHNRGNSNSNNNSTYYNPDVAGGTGGNSNAQSQNEKKEI